MNKFFLTGMALVMTLVLASCSSTNDATVEPTQKSDNSIQSNGATTNKFTLEGYNWYDCHGNVINMDVTVHTVDKFSYDPDTGDYKYMSSSQWRGEGTDSDGNKYILKSNSSYSGTGKSCSWTDRYSDRFQIVQAGSGRIEWAKVHFLIEYDFCESTFNIKVEKIESDCE